MFTFRLLVLDPTIDVGAWGPPPNYCDDAVPSASPPAQSNPTPTPAKPLILPTQPPTDITEHVTHRPISPFETTTQCSCKNPHPSTQIGTPAGSVISESGGSSGGDGSSGIHVDVVGGSETPGSVDGPKIPGHTDITSFPGGISIPESKEPDSEEGISGSKPGVSFPNGEGNDSDGDKNFDSGENSKVPDDSGDYFPEDPIIDIISSDGRPVSIDELTPFPDSSSGQGHGIGSQIQGIGSQGQGIGSQGQGIYPQGQVIGSQGQGISSQGQGIGSQGQGIGHQGQGIGSQGQGISSQGQGIGSQGQGIGHQGQGIGSQGQGIYPQGQGIGSQGQGIYPQGQVIGSEGQGIGSQGQAIGSQGQGIYPQGQGIGSQGQGIGSQGQGIGPQGQGIGPQGQGIGPQGQGIGPQGLGIDSQGQGISSQGPGPVLPEQGLSPPGAGFYPQGQIPVYPTIISGQNGEGAPNLPWIVGQGPTGGSSSSSQQCYSFGCCLRLIKEIASDPGLYEAIRYYYESKNPSESMDEQTGTDSEEEEDRMQNFLHVTKSFSNAIPPESLVSTFNSDNEINQPLYKPIRTFESPSSTGHQRNDQGAATWWVK